MRQPTRPKRKPPEFVRCPVCGVEFCRLASDQRWCSADCAHCAKRLTGGAPLRRKSPRSSGREGRADAGRVVSRRDEGGAASLDQ
jgi:hypothetical protein